MTSTAPDFSSTFDLVDEKLADAEKRLEHRRTRQTRQTKSPPNTESQETEKPTPKVPTPKEVAPKQKRPKQESVSIQIVAKEVRQNLTLKVLAANEAKFHQLFHKLQLKGDSRKKQDLADEAMDLLLAKYAKLF